MKATVKLKKSDLFRFLFYHMYFRPTGIIYAVVGLFTLGSGIYYLVSGNSSGVFLILISAVYFVVQPLFLYMRAAQQIKHPVFAKDTYYVFSEEGVTVSQEGTEEAFLAWENAAKVVRTRSCYYIYVDKLHGNILPKRCFESDTGAFDALVRRRVSEKRRKGFGK